MRFFAWSTVLAFLQTWQFWVRENNFVFDSSPEFNFQNASVFCKCSLAMFKRAALYFDESRSFLPAALQWMPCSFNFHLIVDIYTYSRCCLWGLQLSGCDLRVACYIIYYSSSVSCRYFWWEYTTSKSCSHVQCPPYVNYLSYSR